MQAAVPQSRQTGMCSPAVWSPGPRSSSGNGPRSGMTGVPCGCSCTPRGPCRPGPAGGRRSARCRPVAQLADVDGRPAVRAGRSARIRAQPAVPADVAGGGTWAGSLAHRHAPISADVPVDVHGLDSDTSRAGQLRPVRVPETRPGLHRDGADRDRRVLIDAAQPQSPQAPTYLIARMRGRSQSASCTQVVQLCAGRRRIHIMQQLPRLDGSSVCH